MRALVTASAKVGFGAPYELNHRELVPFRHDRRCVADFEILALACFKELLGDNSDMTGLRCGLYFAGAKDTLALDVDFSEQLADTSDRVAGLTSLSDGLNPLLPLNKLYNIGLYLAGKEGIDCHRHCQYTNHAHADHTAVTAAVRDVWLGSVDVGFAVFSRAPGAADVPLQSIGAVGVRITAGDDSQDAFEVSSGPQPDLLLELERRHSSLQGANLAIGLPVGTARP